MSDKLSDLPNLGQFRALARYVDMGYASSSTEVATLLRAYSLKCGVLEGLDAFTLEIKRVLEKTPEPNDSYIEIAEAAMQAYRNQKALRAELATAQADQWPKCAHCDKPAVCYGERENIREFSCDDHCGHGDEDGWCETLVQSNTLHLIREAEKKLATAQRERDEALGKLKVKDKQFPIMRDEQGGPTTIPWEIGKAAFDVYNKGLYYKDAEAFAARGGFSRGELDMFFPERIERIERAIAKRDTLRRDLNNTLMRERSMQDSVATLRTQLDLALNEVERCYKYEENHMWSCSRQLPGETEEQREDRVRLGIARNRPTPVVAMLAARKETT